MWHLLELIIPFCHILFLHASPAALWGACRTFLHCVFWGWRCLAASITGTEALTWSQSIWIQVVLCPSPTALDFSFLLHDMNRCMKGQGNARCVLGADLTNLSRNPPCWFSMQFLKQVLWIILGEIYYKSVKDWIAFGDKNAHFSHSPALNICGLAKEHKWKPSTMCLNI